MIDPEPGFFEPSSAGVRTRDFEDGERPVNFRFPTTWSSLLVPAPPSKNASALTMVEDRARPVAVAPVESDPEPEAPAPVIEEPPHENPQKPGTASSSDVNWEMIVPKMVRPANRTNSRPLFQTTQPAEPPRTEAPRSEPPPTAPPNPKPAAPPQAKYVVKEYRFGASEQPPSEPDLFAPRLPSKVARTLVVAAVSLVVIALILWLGATSGGPKSVRVESTVGEAGWSRQHTASAGAKQGRQLVLYRPSFNSSDAQIEFNWSLADKSVGWVFRVRDSANYYAMRLKVLGYSRPRSLAAEHFIVAGGKEGAHYEKVLPVSENDSSLQVRMVAAGSKFTLFIEGQVQDEWTDATFASGGLGFLEERNQPAEVQALRLSFSKLPQSKFVSSIQALTKSFQ